MHLKTITHDSTIHNLDNLGHKWCVKAPFSTRGGGKCPREIECVSALDIDQSNSLHPVLCRAYKSS